MTDLIHTPQALNLNWLSGATVDILDFVNLGSEEKIATEV